ncbi:MAG: hypothetical protein V5A58_10430 [Salinibacter sp.]|uniref:hypothetical protein n=1 Tax=Salinibacter sp. TaxID=2065818 RepID=UPI002FC3482C
MSPSSPAATVMDAAFETDGLEALILDVPEAHIRLQPHDEADRVQVQAAVPGVDPDVAEGLSDRKRISTHRSGDRLRVFGRRLSEGTVDWRWRHDRPTSICLDVYLPAGMRVAAQAAGGTVEASDLPGPLDLTVPGGSVHATGLSGALQVQGSGGDVSIQDSTDLALTLEWAAGAITLTRLRQSSITLRAQSCPTTVRDLGGSTDLSVHGAALTLQHVTGSCEAHVRGAPLTYHGAPTQDTTLRTVGGPLQTHLPPDHPAALTLTGSHVTLDDAFSFEGTRTARRVEGQLNGGGASFEGRAVQGTAQCRTLAGT